MSLGSLSQQPPGIYVKCDSAVNRTHLKETLCLMFGGLASMLQGRILDFLRRVLFNK